jgi:hypothetical protein
MLQTPRWLDQPDFDRFIPVTELHMEGAMMVQIADVVFKGHSGVAVSAGNLFGSQTILVPDFREALVALNVLQLQCRKLDSAARNNKPAEPMSVSSYGWQLLPNGDRKAEPCRE